MKRTISLILALSLALTMLTSAFAEKMDVTGKWYTLFMGMQLTLTINEDGTYTLEREEMARSSGTWERTNENTLVMDKGLTVEWSITVNKTCLSTDEFGAKTDFVRQADTTIETARSKWLAMRADVSTEAQRIKNSSIADTMSISGNWYGKLQGIPLQLVLSFLTYNIGTYELINLSKGVPESLGEGSLERNEDGSLTMDKGSTGEGTLTVTKTGFTMTDGRLKIDWTRGDALTIRPEATLDELQGKWQAKSVSVSTDGVMEAPRTMFALGRTCIIEIKDSSLYVRNLLGREDLADSEIKMTFMGGVLLVAMPTPEGMVSEAFAVGVFKDGTVCFEVAVEGIGLDFLMEPVPEK